MKTENRRMQRDEATRQRRQAKAARRAGRRQPKPSAPSTEPKA